MAKLRNRAERRRDEELDCGLRALESNITIKDVPQPGTSYFTLLQSAAISGNGPDLAVMWTGIYDLQYSSYLENLKGNVPART